jgi:hypothetical protein
LFVTVANGVASIDLTPASRRQDHTTSPSAKAFRKSTWRFWYRPAEVFAKADQRRSSSAAAASTASRSNVRDDRETPLKWDGMARS